MAKLAQDLSDLISERPDISALTGATAESRERANEFYRQIALLQQQYNQQLQQQAQLGRQLDRQIAGTAPSVAGTQLQQGLGQTRNAISAQASGASGNNAALANYGAVQALAAAQAKQQQDAAMLRAQEVQNAITAKANLLNNQQQATAGQTSSATGASTALSGQNVAGAGKVADANAAEVGAQRNLLGNVVQGAGSAMTALSDEETKTNKRPIAGNEMDEFLRHIEGFKFNYKPENVGPSAPAGERVGEMAGEVNKGGPIGRAVSDGTSIDLRNAVGALLAAVAHVNRKAEARA